MNQNKLLPHPNEGKRMSDPDFVYVPAAKTNVMDSFRKMGWIPPSELKAQQENSNATR